MRIYRWEKHVTSSPHPLYVQSSVPDRNSVATLK